MIDKLFFAWVEEGEAFTPLLHLRKDINIVKMEIEHVKSYAVVKIWVPIIGPQDYIDRPNNCYQQGGFAFISYDQTPLIKCRKVSIGQDGNLLKMELHAKPSDYEQQVSQIIQEHGFDQIFFMKQQSHVMVKNFIIVDRLTLKVDFKLQGNLLKMPVHFPTTLKKFQVNPGIKDLQVTLDLRWKHTIHGQGDLLEYAEPHFKELIQTVPSNGVRLGNFIIHQADLEQIEAHWTIPVLKNEKLLLDIQTNLDHTKSFNKTESLKLYLNFDHLNKSPVSWEGDKDYYQGDIVGFEGQKYICKRNHKSQDWDPLLWGLQPPWNEEFMLASEYGAWVLHRLLDLVGEIIHQRNQASAAEFELPIERAFDYDKGTRIEGLGRIHKWKVTVSHKGSKGFMQTLDSLTRLTKEEIEPHEESKSYKDFIYTKGPGWPSPQSLHQQRILRSMPPVAFEPTGRMKLFSRSLKDTNEMFMKVTMI